MTTHRFSYSGLGREENKLATTLDGRLRKQEARAAVAAAAEQGQTATLRAFFEGTTGDEKDKLLSEIVKRHDGKITSALRYRDHKGRNRREVQISLPASQKRDCEIDLHAAKVSTQTTNYEEDRNYYGKEWTQ